MANADLTAQVEYRPIAGIEGYRVGSDGSVWSCWVRGKRPHIGCNWRALRPRLTCGQHGQLQASFKIGNRRFTRNVHRLVLEAFVGPPPTKRHYPIHHPDPSAGNCRLDNLRWGLPEWGEREYVPSWPIIDGVSFADIPGAPGYIATDDGRIFCCRGLGSASGTFVEWRELRPTPFTNGRLFVSVSVNGRSRKQQVHRLVMLAFRGECPAQMEVCHNNGDHTDNRLKNLRYDTRRANQKDKVIHGTAIRGTLHPLAKLSSDDVRKIRKLLDEGAISTRVAAKHFGISRALVMKIRDREAWGWLEDE